MPQVKWLFIVLFLAPLACKERDDDATEKRERKTAEHAATRPAHESDEVKLSSEAIRKNGIKLEKVTKHVLAPTFVAPARISYNTEAIAQVGSPLAGRVAEVKVKAGDVVKQGDELLSIESFELGEAQSDYFQKRTAAEVATSAIEPMKNVYERGKTLYEKSEGISLGELQKRAGELKAAHGALEMARAALRASENKLHLLGLDEKAAAQLVASGKINPRFSVRAPISGRVIERKVTLGELVGPDKESLMVLADMTTLWVLADVPEAKISDVAIGAKALVRVAAASKAELQGSVSFISPSLDPTTRSAQVRIDVKNAPGMLKPGMFAQAEIAGCGPSGSAPEAVIALPENAVMTVEGRPADFVAVAGEENTFAKRPVGVGSAIGGMLPILSGLKEGEQVVVNGTFILKAELGKGAAEHDND